MSPSYVTEITAEQVKRIVDRRMTRREASKFLQNLLPEFWRTTPIGRVWNPTTTTLRVALHHPATPRGVKNHVYQMLQYRRHRSRARRHGG